MYLNGILKGVLLILPQVIVEAILQDMFRGYSIRYSILFISPSLNKLRFVLGFSCGF